MIELTVLSFIAGILTVAAPCILPLLPVIVGGSTLHGIQDKKHKQSLKHPLIITSSLVVSIITFTLLLKATTALLGIPVSVWSAVAGSIVILFGVNLIFPSLWEKLMIATGWQAGSNRLLSKAQRGDGVGKDILLGAALGPIFNSCSPTYALIVAAILPASFSTGLLYLTAYAIGVAAILLVVSLVGRSVIQKIAWLSNPNGPLKRIIGILFIIVGGIVVLEFDKQIQTYALENGLYDPIMRLEQSLF